MHKIITHIILNLISFLRDFFFCFPRVDRSIYKNVLFIINTYQTGLHFRLTSNQNNEYLISKKNLQLSQFLFCLLLLVNFFLTTSTRISAQKPESPVFDDQRIPRPSGLPLFKTEDLKVDPNRINQYTEGFLYADHQIIKKMSDYLLNDPEGIGLWKREADKAVKILNQWEFDRSGFPWDYLGCFCTDRYIYCVPQLENLSLVYLFSGHKPLGMFIREHILQIAELPYEFWLHSELRGYDPGHPVGKLETSDLCITVALALSAAPDIFSVREKEMVETSLHTKGLKLYEFSRLISWQAI